MNDPGESLAVRRGATMPLNNLNMKEARERDELLMVAQRRGLTREKTERLLMLLQQSSPPLSRISLSSLGGHDGR